MVSEDTIRPLLIETVDLLRDLQHGDRADPTVAPQAKKLEHSLVRILNGGPRGTVSDELHAFAERVAKSPRKKAGKYATAPFRCLEDYDQCCKDHDWKVCTALVTICLGRQLIPFIPKD
jgi:hypothetical protein